MTLANYTPVPYEVIVAATEDKLTTVPWEPSYTSSTDFMPYNYAVSA